MATSLRTATPEIGQPGGHAESWHHDLGPGYIATGYEETPELEFPASIAVYDKMRRTEGQIGAVLRAINLPILANRHHLSEEGVRPAVRKYVETELGLGIDDRQAARRRRVGVVFKDHLREALLSLPLGFMPFQRIYEPGPPTPEQKAVEGMPTLVAHLRKLAPRLPRTVNEVRVERNGDLAGVLQAGVGWDATGKGAGVTVIGGPGMDQVREQWIDRRFLAMYCFDREGANWTGNSILRTAYKNWLIKDGMIRTDALAGERNGMGVPVVYYTEEGSKTEALGIAQGLRAGAYAGGAVPDGKYRVELLGVQGQVKDLLPSIQYHDQAMGRSALAMFLNLGHDGGLGHGAIGDTFVDYFTLSLRAVDEWLCEVVTEEIIADMVALTFGPDEPYPVLLCDEITAEGTPTAEGLKALVDAKLIDPDPTLRTEIRRRYGLPEPDQPDVTLEPQPGFTDAPGDLQPVNPLDPAVTQPTDPNVPVDKTAPLDPMLATAERLVNRLAQLRAAANA